MWIRTKWRPFVTHLTGKEILREHQEQFGIGNNDIVDVIDVTDPLTVKSVLHATE